MEDELDKKVKNDKTFNIQYNAFFIFMGITCALLLVALLNPSQDWFNFFGGIALSFFIIAIIFLILAVRRAGIIVREEKKCVTKN